MDLPLFRKLKAATTLKAASNFLMGRYLGSRIGLGEEKVKWEAEMALAMGKMKIATAILRVFGFETKMVHLLANQLSKHLNQTIPRTQSPHCFFQSTTDLGWLSTRSSFLFHQQSSGLWLEEDLVIGAQHMQHE